MQRVAWNKGKKGLQVGFWNGKKMSEEHRRKLSESCRRVALEKGYGKWMIGKKWSDEHKMKMVEIKKNKSATRWIADRTKLSDRGVSIRRSSRYSLWRKDVWSRDNFKCKIANQDCAGRIEAHHILPIRNYPELIFDINNAITLCKFHHPRKRVEEQRLAPIFQQLIQSS